MKARLIKLISEIFSTLQITEDFEVFECENDMMPVWANQILLTHEFLICTKQLTNKEKLKKILRKEIFQNEEILYWFEGEQFIKNKKQMAYFSKFTTDPKETEIEYLKTKTRLPQWLDDYIFNQLNAEYIPDFQRYENNLNLNEDENLKYLGTYFPRSYAESFCIFDNIFQNKQYQKIILQKDILNILSVGSGTGGDLVGLITVIKKFHPNIHKINIWAIDGNKEALSVLKKVIEKFGIQHLISIDLKTTEIVFKSISQINIEQIDKLSFDFILSFKMICEIISTGKGIYDNSYYDFMMKFVPMLSEKGLCILLDVTTKMKHNNTYNPIMKNSQVNQAIRELNKFQTLLPLSCYRNEKKCIEQCFTQQKFYVSHSRKTNDISKVSYRVIGKMEFVSTLVNQNLKARYVLQIDRQNVKKYCPNTHGEKIIDGYKLNKI